MRREAFLLRCLAALFAVQFLIYLAGAGACIYVGLRDTRSVCQEFDQNLQRSFETALATVLALLGGSTLGKD